MITIQRGFEWYSGGTVSPSRTVFTSDPGKLPQPLYDDPINGFRWVGYEFPSWVPQRFAITYCRFIFEPGVDGDAWKALDAPNRLIEAQIWIDPGGKSYMGATPPGSEGGGDLFQRVTSVFHDWPTPGDQRFYSQWQVPVTPFWLDRTNGQQGDHLNIEIGNGVYPLAWALMEIGIQTTDTTVWPGY